MFFDSIYEFSGLYIFKSRIFAASMAVLVSFVLSMLLFPKYIKKLQRMHFNSELDSKKHQPVMPGGIFFMAIISLVTLLTSRFNSYVISAVVVYIFYGAIGAVDDIAKIFNKQKLLRNEITVKDYQTKTDGISASLRLTLYLIVAALVAIFSYKFIPNISGEVTIPFIKNTVYLPAWAFIPMMTFAIAVMANGVNFTDGFDTLSTVPLITNFSFIALIAYISSRPDWSAYFLVPHIAGVAEIIPLVGAVVGVLLAFLWFNAPPSTIIMGDSGSIGLGGMVGIMFVFIKAEFYLPVIGFIFLVEFGSVCLQIFWFKLTKRRIFLCAPIHHHFQFALRNKKVYNREGDIRSKITWQFHIVSIRFLTHSVHNQYLFSVPHCKVC